MKIACIGGGNMISAIVAGLRSQGFEGGDITVKDPHEDKRRRLNELYGVNVAEDAGEWISGCDVVVLGVKPQGLEAALKEISKFIAPNATVLSIAAGVGLEALERWSGARHVVRAMPNTPAMVAAGFVGLYAPDDIGAEHRERVEKIVAGMGRFSWFDKEDDLHVVTGGPGSGVAYVFLFLEGLQKALVNQGVSQAQAKELALSTVTGAARLAEQSAEDFAQLRKNVTSKGGTTAQALAVFEAQDWCETIDQAVKACIARSKEMSELFR